MGRLRRRVRHGRVLTMPAGAADLSRYADAARAAASGACACDGGSPFGAGHYDDLADVPDMAQRISLGRGNPVAVAELHLGDTVLDLGSGGGLDLVLSARRVGSTGRVIGIDATAEMDELSRRNARDAGADNVEVVHGSIDVLPIPDASIDVVISNCVLVLVADKAPVLAEIARVLRPGGRVGISDIVRTGPMTTDPTPVDCADSALEIAAYDDALRDAGLVHVEIELTDPLGAGLSNAVVRARRSPVAIRPMQSEDWPVVTAIYAAGIDLGNATFETTVPTWADWDDAHLGQHRLVAVHGDRVVGWTAISAVSDRCVYGGVAEHSVYVDPHLHGRGVGSALLDVLVHATERAGIWTLQSGIFPENAASLALHERAGFRIVGRRERLGQHHGAWRDVLLLERRSSRI